MAADPLSTYKGYLLGGIAWFSQLEKTELFAAFTNPRMLHLTGISCARLFRFRNHLKTKKIILISVSALRARLLKILP